jgi:tetratricopeptide (TPR) repeat protein
MAPLVGDYDWREPVIGLGFASPALLALCVFGLVVCLRRWRAAGEASPLWPAVVGACAAAGVPLLFFAITQRYANDMLPLLVVGGAMAMGRAETLPRRARAPLAALMAVATLWSALVWWQAGAYYRQWGADIKIWPYRGDEVIAAYERQLRLEPSDARAHAELGYIHHLGGRPQPSRRHLELALRLDPRDASSLLLLGLQRAPADPEAGIALLQRAVDAAPRSLATRTALASVLIERGRRAEALEQLHAARALDPDDPRVHHMLSTLSGGAAGRPSPRGAPPQP